MAHLRLSQNATLTESFKELVDLCDTHIKAGRINQVEALLKHLNFASIPREYRQSLAKVCRRCGFIGQGLRILHPIVRHENAAAQPATASEICEYSVLLSRNGSIPEALGLLAGVDAVANPESLLYTAYCHISHWDYAKSVNYLERFLASTADDYAKLIARVNLVASYVVTSQLHEAAKLLSETIEVAEKAGAHRLVGNCYELWGQVYFWQNEYEKARASLKKALEIFGTSQSYDQLLIAKTEAIMSALETKSIKPLLDFRREALARKHPESVRETDLFLLKVKFDQQKMDHLIFGTPMLAYRQRIEQVLQASPSPTYVFGKIGSPCLDLHTGTIEKRDRKRAPKLNAGKKIHQVLVSLMKDYYVPRNMGTLFSELYPNEYFDINSSPFRVRQLMMRARQWLKDNKIPASIVQSENSYSLVIEGDFSIRVHLESESIEGHHLKWEQLAHHFHAGSSFSAEQACELLKCSRTAFRRWVDTALQQGHLQRTGVGKATRYRVLQVKSLSKFKTAA